MPFLGLDYGDKHIGLAFSPNGKVAYCLSQITNSASKDSFPELKKICDEYSIEKIIIGLPLDQEGKLSSQAKKVKKFGESFKKTYRKIKVSYWNETLSSTQARQKMIEAGVPKSKRKELEHSFAAQILLQEFLDAKQM